MITVMDAVASLRPGMPCIIYANDLATIEWHVEGVVTPSQAEVDAEITRLENEQAQKAADRAEGLRKMAQSSGLTEAELAALGL